MERLSKGGRYNDRLCSLPDHILIEILSLLPLKTAVSASVLSHRWPHLWTQITSFSVIISETDLLSYKNYDEKFKQLTSPSILRLDLSLNAIFKNIPRITSLINSWVIDVCARNVEKIKVVMSLKDWELPLCVFETRSLVELDIDNLNCLKLPCITNLPNLKKLSIKGRVYTPSMNLFEKFINSCSSLEDLYFFLLVNHTNMNSEISFIVPNLKRLGMKLYPFRGNIVIDAPKLEYFTFDGPMDIRFMQVSSALLGTLIGTQLQQCKKANILVLEFIESICQSVRHLELGPFERCSNLASLKLEFLENLEFEKLMKFLEIGHVLKVPSLKINLNNDWRWKEWHSSRLTQFQANVIKVEIEIEKGELLVKHKKNVVNLVKCLVTTASKDLKELTITVGYDCWRRKLYNTFGENLVKCLVKIKEEINYEINLSKTTWSFVALF